MFASEPNPMLRNHCSALATITAACRKKSVVIMENPLCDSKCCVFNVLDMGRISSPTPHLQCLSLQTNVLAWQQGKKIESYNCDGPTRSSSPAIYLVEDLPGGSRKSLLNISSSTCWASITMTVQSYLEGSPDRGQGDTFWTRVVKAQVKDQEKN